MAGQINRHSHKSPFVGGMDQDKNPADVAPEAYIRAVNAVSHSAGNGGGSIGDEFRLSNEPGFTVFSDFSSKRPNHLVLGMCPLDGAVIVFSIEADAVESFKTKASEIGVVEPDGVYRTVLRDTDLSYWETGNVPQTHPTGTQILSYDFGEFLNFDVRHQIEAVARLAFNNRRVVYWTDGYNPPRWIDLDVDYTTERFNNVAQQTRLFDVFNWAQVSYLETVEGGFLRAGVYQFFVRYLNKTLDPTIPSLFCHPIPVTVGDPSGDPLQIYGANFDADFLNKAIRLRLTNLDRDYDFCELCVVYYSGGSSVVKINVAQRLRITSETLEYTFDGQVGAELTVDEVNQIKPVYSKAQHIAQKDGRLLLANLSEYGSQSLQPIANRLRLKYVVKQEDAYDENSLTAQTYKDPRYTFEFKGYRRGECYSFGIQALMKDGTETFVAHIPGWDAPSSPLAFRTPATQDPSPPPAGYDSWGWLGTQFSALLYDKEGVHLDPDTGTDLFNTPLRYHLMPDLALEPHVTTGTDTPVPRILGIMVEGLEDALLAYPELASQIAVLNIVRQERDTSAKKSIYGMGFANELLLQDGELKQGSQYRTYGNLDVLFMDARNTPSIYRNRLDDYLGEQETQIYVPQPFCGLNVLHDYNCVQFNNGRFKHLRIPGSTGTEPYQQSGADPGSDPITPYTGANGYPNNIRQNAPPELWGWQGRSEDDTARKNCLFYCPENIFLGDSWDVPSGTKMKAVMRLRSEPVRIVKFGEVFTTNRTTVGNVQISYGPGKDINMYDVHYGWNGDDSYYPLGQKHRSPFFHIYYDWRRYDAASSAAAEQSVNSVVMTQKVQWNQKIDREPDIETYCKTLVADTTKRLNMYDAEDAFLFQMENDVFVGLAGTGPDGYGTLDVERTFIVIGNTAKRGGSGDDMEISPKEQLENLQTSSDERVSGQNQIYIEGNRGDNRPNRTFPASDPLCKMVPIPVRPLNEGLYPDAFLFTDRAINTTLYRSPYRYDDPARNVAYQHRYLHILDSENKTQYGSLDAKQYVLVESLFPDATVDNPNNVGLRRMTAASTYQMFNGDTFVVKFAYRNSWRLHHWLAHVKDGKDIRTLRDSSTAGNEVWGGFTRVATNHGAELRALQHLWVESEVNTDYRHRAVERDDQGDIAGYGSAFYPHLDREESLFNAFDFESSYGQSSGYNVQYSFGHRVKTYVTEPFGFELVREFPTRIAYSEQSLEGEQSDQYRQFLPNNYQDTPKNKGEVTGIFVFDNALYAHTERSLWRTFFNQGELQQVGQESVFVGTGAIFGRPPQEVQPLLGGYAGSIHKWAGVLTPFGYVFPDYHQRKVFMLSNQLEEISSVGMYGWFRDFMPILGVSDPANPKFLNNPANPLATGLTAYYDPKHRRVVMGIKRIPFSAAHKDQPYFEAFDTLSFNCITKKWVSMHTYFPAVSCTTDTFVVSSPNLGAKNANRLWLHQDGVFGVYYGNAVPHYFEIEFVANPNPDIDKVFDVQNLRAEFRKDDAMILTEFFNEYQHRTLIQNSGTVQSVVRDPREKFVSNEFAYNVRWHNRQYQIQIPRSYVIDAWSDVQDTANVDQSRFPEARQRSRWMISRYRYNNPDNYYLFLYWVETVFRMSFR